MAQSLLSVLKGARVDPPPCWFMRQAGRYLPEYRALRAEKGGFLELVYDSEAAAEITLQPVRRFGFDAAILFSDILIVPYAMGQELAFLAGEGPALSPPLAVTTLAALNPQPQRLQPIYDTVAWVAGALDPAVTLLGFAGSPWTVATYMVAGEGSRDQAAARRMAYLEPERFQQLVDAITAMTVDYLSGQIVAGVHAVQLFDSWSGSLAPDEFERWVIAPTRAIISAVKARHPSVPVIGFPKGAGGNLVRYAEMTGADCIGLDETVDPSWAHAALPRQLAVQGNLDPLLLLAGGPPLAARIAHIRDALADRPHVFNLGHGIDKETPIAHVDASLAAIRAPR
jgi:uroporphyrinogen decarboxylase